MKPGVILAIRRADVLGLRRIAPFAVASVLLIESLFGNAPDFTQYPVSSIFHGHPSKPKFRPGADTWPDSDPRFRSTVEFELAKGANFAGQYTIVQTTCGTGCSYIVVVDTRTGEIFGNLPFRMIVVGRPGEFEGPSYRLNSRLLVIEGFVDESKTATRSYYVWEGTTFRLLRKAPITPH